MLDDSLTFRDLLVRVAEQLGVHAAPVSAGDVAGPPTDAYELDRCKRAINDGMEEMARAYTKWRVLRPVVTVALAATAGAMNIAGDVGRVRLESAHLLVPISQWSWKLADSTGFGGQLVMLPMARLLALSVGSDNLGAPVFASIGPTSSDAEQPGQRRVIELRVWPRPDQNYTLTGEARVQIPKLTEDGEYSPFGSQHDQTVIAAAMMIAHRNHPDLSMRKWYVDLFGEAMARSIKLDGELAAASAGVARDGAMDRMVMAGGEIGNTVSKYNGVSI